MSTLKKECIIIYPPGDSIREIKDIESSGEITVKHTFTNTPPLVPHVKALKVDNYIAVEAIVFIDSKIEPKLHVSQLLSVNMAGKFQLQFFIHCKDEDIHEVIEERSRTTYKAYTLKFDTENIPINFPEGVTLDHIKIIQTFLWNVDPETSRGTESVVQTTD